MVREQKMERQRMELHVQGDMAIGGHGDGSGMSDDPSLAYSAVDEDK